MKMARFAARDADTSAAVAICFPCHSKMQQARHGLQEASTANIELLFVMLSHDVAHLRLFDCMSLLALGTGLPAGTQGFLLPRQPPVGLYSCYHPFQGPQLRDQASFDAEKLNSLHCVARRAVLRV